MWTWKLLNFIPSQSSLLSYCLWNLSSGQHSFFYKQSGSHDLEGPWPLYREPLSFCSKEHHELLSSSFASSTQMTSTALPVSTLSTFSFFLCIVSRVILKKKKKKTLQIYLAKSLLSIFQWLHIHWSEVQTPYDTSTRPGYFMDLVCICSLQAQRTCCFSNMLSTVLLQARYICCFSLPGTFSTLIAPWLILLFYSGLYSDVLFS